MTEPSWFGQEHNVNVNIYESWRTKTMTMTARQWQWQQQFQPIRFDWRWFIVTQNIWQSNCFCNRSSRQDISISWGASGQGQRQQSGLVDDYTMSTPASDAPTVSVIIAVTCSDWPSDFLSIFVSLVTMAVDRIFLQPLLKGSGEGVRNPRVPRTLFTCTDWIQSSVLHTLQTGGSSSSSRRRRRQSAASKNHLCSHFKSIQSSQLPLPEQNQM